MELTTSTKNVLDNLSFSEMNAIKAILVEMEGAKEKQVVMSNIADKTKLARSVFVNTLRLLSCAGIVYTRSLGMKGQYIKILNQDAMKLIVEG